MSIKHTYSIRKLPKGDFSHLILSLNEIRIDEYLHDIELKLRSKKISGLIAFDLLILNGSQDRYYTAIFNGKNFDLSSFKPVKDNVTSLYNTSNKFFSKNISLINESSISNTKKFLLKRQLQEYST